MPPLLGQKNFACEKVNHLVDYIHRKVNLVATFNEGVQSFRDAVTAKNVPLIFIGKVNYVGGDLY